MKNEHLLREGFAFEPPLEFFHLSGGLSLLLGANRQAWLMSPDQQRPTFFSVVPRAEIRTLFVEQTNLRFLGRTRFQHASELHDFVSDNFSIAAQGSKRTCLANSQSALWDGISNRLHHDQRNADALLATRIQRQIRLSLSRVERLSGTYRSALAATTDKPISEADKTNLTSDKYAYWLGSDYRSCLNELYSLRDAILAAHFRLCLKRNDPFSIKKLRASVLQGTDEASTLISESMFATSGDLLIDQMSLYRNIALHCIGATNPIFGDVYQRRMSSGPFGEIPYLVFPLYDNIEAMRELEQGSSKGLFEPIERAEAERFLSISNHKDALEFSYDCLVRLLQISERVAEGAGIAPKTLTTTDQDIIEASITDAAGKTTRVRRDQGTGKLIEY